MCVCARGTCGCLLWTLRRMQPECLRHADQQIRLRGLEFHIIFHLASCRENGYLGAAQWLVQGEVLWLQHVAVSGYLRRQWLNIRKPFNLSASLLERLPRSNPTFTPRVKDKVCSIISSWLPHLPNRLLHVNNETDTEVIKHIL